MANYTDTRSFIGNHIADDIKKRNRQIGFSYSVSEIANATKTYAGTIGISEVRDGIISDLKSQGIIVSYVARGQRKYFTITNIDV